MKQIIRIMLLTVIVCSAFVSVNYATQLYRSKYVPRYLSGRAR